MCRQIARLIAPAVLGCLLLVLCGEANARIRMYGGPVTGASGGRYYPPGGVPAISVEVKKVRSSGMTGEMVNHAFLAEQERQRHLSLSMRSVPFWSGEIGRAVLFRPGGMSQSASELKPRSTP